MKTFDSFTVSDEYEGLTVEDYLKQVLKYSGRKIQKLTRNKGILLNGKTVFLQKKVKPRDVIRILSLEDKSYGVLPEGGEIDILYEDRYLIVLNKPGNLLVHPTGRTTHGTLANYLAFYYQKCGVTLTIRPLHRLDRETSGCVVFAKDSRTQSILEQQLHNGKLKRNYLAIVQGLIQPPDGTINAPIGPHLTMPNRRAILSQGDSAVTHYRTVQNFADTTLVELTLETGRTHQIRLHLTHIGHPIIGDRMYGKQSLIISRQALHACFVHFSHPSDEREIIVHAPIPSDFEYAMEICSI